MILRLVLGAIVGGGLSFAYYTFVGCSSGTCPITSNPFISTIYGMVAGALIASSFNKKKETEIPHGNDHS